MHTFEVWAPKVKRVMLKLGEETLAMDGPDDFGWYRLKVPKAQCGMDYMYLLDDDATAYPDPRSLWQANGVHGPSRLYDHGAFEWTDAHWQPPLASGAIIHEMHIGTFSPQGTFDSAIEYLDHLVELGITHIELLPVAEFAGNRGWGYDGVALFAVFEPYGGPDALKRFVDACHAKSLAVVMDVVYNHFGPVGNYTNKFGWYLTEDYQTPWGAAVNFSKGGCDEVRRYLCDNAIMFLRDYHMDGLRLDAVHEFIDRSAVHFMEQLSAEVEQLSATLGRKLILIAESDLNDPKIVRPREAGGFGMDSQWSDDFHHSLFTLLYDKEPGKGYYDDFGRIEQLEKTLKGAFAYTGEYSHYRKHSHGRPVDNLSAHHFLGFDQNHDQVGNRALGERLEHLIGMDGAKVALGLVLTAPFLPMLFMGEEFAASAPFLYFADHEDEEMRRLVSEGRKNDFKLFFGEIDVPDPEAIETFERSKLNWGEVHEGKHEEMLQWTKDLIKLRRTTAALNDGDFGHVRVETDSECKTLAMTRGIVRVLINFGKAPWTVKVKEDEEVCMTSRSELTSADNRVVLEPLTLVILRQRDKPAFA